MSSIPPLSYDSLKTVLVCMTANSRIRLSACCPSIRYAEKAVPLRIESLELMGDGFVIDDITYSVRIYKKYPSRKWPLSVSDPKHFGEEVSDLDQHGFKDWATTQEIRPGDVDLRGPEEKSEVMPVIDDAWIERNKEKLPDDEKRLAYVESLGPIISGSKSYSWLATYDIFKYFNGMKMMCEANVALPGLKPYIYETSYPFKKLQIYVFDTAVFQNPIVRNAHHLVIDRVHNQSDIDWLHIFLDLENQEIHKTGEDDADILSLSACIELIKKKENWWKTSGK